MSTAKLATLRKGSKEDHNSSNHLSWLVAAEMPTLSIMI